MTLNLAKKNISPKHILQQIYLNFLVHHRSSNCALLFVLLLSLVQYCFPVFKNKQSQQTLTLTWDLQYFEDDLTANYKLMEQYWTFHQYNYICFAFKCRNTFIKAFFHMVYSFVTLAMSEFLFNGKILHKALSMGHRQPQAIRGRLSVDLWEVKVFVLSVPTVGNDPSGQCMCVWEYMWVDMSGTNDDGW